MVDVIPKSDVISRCQCCYTGATPPDQEQEASIFERMQLDDRGNKDSIRYE